MAQRKKNVAYLLNDAAPSFRNRLFMASLKNLGHEPLVIAWSQAEGSGESVRKSERQGLTVYTINTKPGKGAGRAYRKLLKQALSSMEHGLETVYLTHISHLRFFAFSGKKKYRLAYDATEAGLPEVKVNFQPLRVLVGNVLELLERRLLKMAGVETVTLSGSRAGSLPLVKKVCANSSVVQTVPALSQCAAENDSMRAREKIGKNRVVAAVGDMSGSREIEYALEVAGNVADAYGDVLFLFFGRTSVDKKSLKRIIEKSNLEGRVHFLGEMPYRKMMSWLENSHVGLALDSGTGAFGTTGDRSMRMFSYMQAGLPVVGAAYCAGGAVARDAGCGLFVDTSSPVEVAGSVAYLLTHPEKAREHGQRGLKAFRGKYNWDMERKNLISLFGDA